MPTTAPHNVHATTPERVLFVAFERSDKTCFAWRALKNRREVGG